jgi:plasmid stability protein
MKKQEHTLTIRLSKDTMMKLRDVAKRNHCSVSDIARDILTDGIDHESYEHVFSNKEAWEKAVLSRDKRRCTVCGATRDLRAYLLPAPEGSGEYTLSNGTTLCFACFKQRIPLDTLPENGHSIYDILPKGWQNKYNHAREKGRKFWELHLACFLTRRKRVLSPIVMWYAETFLQEVPEEVIIRTLIELCPSPDIIAAFPSRRQASTNEAFPPPPLVWS